MNSDDHYAVLGLPSGEEGARLSDKDIAKAYRIRALELHPDKNPNDPNAQIYFQKLKDSYEILKDEKARKQYDDLVRASGHRTTKRRSTNDAKWEKTISDLERAEMRSDLKRARAQKEDEEEELTMKKLKEEIAEIRAKYKRRREEEIARNVSMQAKARAETAAATPPMSPPRRKEETEDDGPWKSAERFQAKVDLVYMRRVAERQKKMTK